MFMQRVKTLSLRTKFEGKYIESATKKKVRESYRLAQYHRTTTQYDDPGVPQSFSNRTHLALQLLLALS